MKVIWTSESKAFVLVRDQKQMGLVTNTVAGATVGLWRATPPVIPEKLTSPGPALAITENWSHVDNFFMRMRGKNIWLLTYYTYVFEGGQH